MSLISMIPSREAANIYCYLLYEALESVGVRYEQVPYSLRYLLRQGPRQRFHYLHFHWPEIFFTIRPREPQRLCGLKGFFALHAFLALAKLRGYRLVWTVHEVDVHVLTGRPWGQALSRRCLFRLCDVVFAHTASVGAEAERRWGKKRHLHTIPTPSYPGVYPDTLSRAEARARLGIPAGAYAFVLAGNLRPYKGVDILVDAFRSLQADHPDVHLILAGKPSSDAYRAEIESRCQGLRNLHLHFGFIPDDEIQVYLRAADCYVAPFRYIETTGSVHLPLAFDLPVIIKLEGNVQENFAGHELGVWLRDAGETEDAMRRMLQLTPAERERLQANIRAAVRLYSWDNLRHDYRAAFDAFEVEHGAAPAAPQPRMRPPAPA